MGEKRSPLFEKRGAIGVIGGSGLYEMAGLDDVASVSVDTPFGPPSDALITGTLDGVPMVFLPRHGRGHRIPPSELNFRANVFAMKKLGVSWIVSVSAVGSMREEIRPGEIVVVDQFFDRTKGRPSFFMAKTFARKLSSDGGILCPRPCRGRNTIGTPYRVPVIKASDGGPKGVSTLTEATSSRPAIS